MRGRSALVILSAASVAHAFTSPPILSSLRPSSTRHRLSNVLQSTEPSVDNDEPSPPASASVVDPLTSSSPVPAPTSPSVPKTAAEIQAEIDAKFPEAARLTMEKIRPGRYAETTQSVAFPFLPRPPKLDGSHAGDFGFDPLGFTENFDLYYLQESEVRHARLAMLAVVGWPLGELIGPNFLKASNGLAPSILNGHLLTNPLNFLTLLLVFGGLGFFEYKTAFRSNVDTKFGRVHKADLEDVWNFGVAGTYNFDPLNFYSKLGDDAYGRKAMRDLELQQGRYAMVGIAFFAFWEAMTKSPVTEGTFGMFFHPNVFLPILGLAWWYWSR